MRLKLTIDVRERDLIECCRTIMTKHSLTDSLVCESLPIGDIIISNADTGEDLIIIERKTLADLAASIKDGRYAEQSFRLNGISHPNHNIVYLIEGDITRLSIFKSRLDKNTLYSAMFSINYFKGFSLMRSNTLEESATIICNMVVKLLKSGNKVPHYKQQPQKQEGEEQVLEGEENKEQEKEKEKDDSQEYCSVVKRVKKDNITKANIGEIMLCQIPGCSDVSVRAVFQKFKTISQLISAIQEDATCLDDIKTTMANGKTRKISKAVIKSIIDFLKD
jgi:ERCC4-type nuclease